MSTLHYKYDEQGRKIKGITEYPVIGKSKVTVFSYKNNLLERKVEYDELGRKLTYTDYEYDETGLLTKETIRDPETSEVLRYSEYRNENGLNMEIMVYTSLPTEKKPIELRRITKSYDQNGNLHQLVSEELASSSSQSSFSESYEYIEGVRDDFIRYGMSSRMFFPSYRVPIRPILVRSDFRSS